MEVTMTKFGGVNESFGPGVRMPAHNSANDGAALLELQRFLFRDNMGIRMKVLGYMTRDDVFTPVYGLSVAEQRDMTFRRLQKFAAGEFLDCMDVVRNPKRFAAVMECLSLVDYSLSIKGGVHFTLCGGTIAKLGTARHHEEYIPKINTAELPGCFAMTELDHGSNVMGIETTAVYDRATDEFIINTPHDNASKFWIGGAAQHAKVSTVFAQLSIDRKWLGVHVFVARLRDDHGRVVPGVRIEDNGPKMGLNGVDNGRIWFDNYRVPRSSLLDKYAKVDRDGTYHSPVSSVGQRFGLMVGGLTTGRILIAHAAVDACKLGLTIAIRYSSRRTQFGNKKIIDYLSHQRRLVPGLAETYALHFGMLDLMEQTAASGEGSSAKDAHVLSSGLKAAATWSRVDILQNCRECCGGMGVLAVNQIGPMICDMNVDVTFEGSNPVLMQQVSKALLKDAPKLLTNFDARPPQLDGQLDDLSITQFLRYREGALLGRLAKQISRAQRSGSAPEDAFDDNLDLVLALAWAFVERKVFEVFARETAQAPPEFRDSLLDLCRLYGLSRLEKDAGFFMGSGCFNAADFDRVHGNVNESCRRLARDGGKVLLQLCEGFAIPEQFITAPIAKESTNFPSAIYSKL